MRAGPVAASEDPGSDWRCPSRRQSRYWSLGAACSRPGSGGLALVAIYSRLMQSLLSNRGVYNVADVDGALARVFGAGVRPLHLERAVFEAMLSAWRGQQTARYLKPKTIHANETAVRRRRARRLLAVGVACVACG
jgi:hypothetical protein